MFIKSNPHLIHLVFSVSAIKQLDRDALNNRRKAGHRKYKRRACIQIIERSWRTVHDKDDDDCFTLAGLSLIAVGPNEDVVGACINGCHEPRNVLQMEADADVCPNPKFQKILQFLAFVDRRADVFGKFPETSKVLEINMVAVVDNWRGKGVATALLDRTRSVHNSSWSLPMTQSTPANVT